MVRSSLWIALAAAAARSLAMEIIPNRFIVEFENGADVDGFYKKIHSTDTVKTRMNFTSQRFFHGASIQLDNPAKDGVTLKEIREMPNVKVWHVRSIPAPDPIVHWTGTPGMDYSVLSKRQQPPAVLGSNITVHIQTQIDKLRAEGMTGKGIKVVVVDTGIDYKNPALGGCFGPGCLVSFGADIVGDDYSGSRQPIRSPDADPMDCNGHGTHVAGIIAAQPNSFGFTGAAPGVTLGIVKTMGCSGGTESDVMVDSFLKAASYSPDIITSSIGSACGWSEEPWAVTAERIVKSGTVVTIAAGNSGEEGLFFSSTAADGKGVMSISSFDNSATLSSYSAGTFTVDGQSKEFGYAVGDPAYPPNLDLELWALDYNLTDTADGCEPFPASTPNLRGKLVLLRRGTCTFSQKFLNANKFGAEYLMIYNHEAGTASIGATDAAPALKGLGIVPPEQGAEWIGLLQSKKTVRVRLPDRRGVPPHISSTENKKTGGSVSGFSTWGPTWEIDFKPSFGAIGGMVLSTYPVEGGSFAVLSGTSMACPMVAAAVALIMEKRGTKNPQEIFNLLSITATPVPHNNGSVFDGYLASAAQQGAGLIQAYKAATSQTITDRPNISFNDTANRVNSTTFTISNLGKTDLTYKLSNVMAPTFYLKNDSTTILAGKINEVNAKLGAKLTFSAESVAVPAGGKATVTVSAAADAGLDPKRFPVWSGWIALNASDGTSFSLPYMGVEGSMYSLKPIEEFYMAEMPPLPPGAQPLEEGNFPRLPDNATLVLPTPGTANSTVVKMSNITWPGLNIRHAMGTALTRADLVSLDNPPRGNTVEFMGIKSAGQHREFPLEYATRDGKTAKWDGELLDGSFALPGRYKWVLHSLRIFGDKNNPADWDKAESTAFTVTYAQPRAPTVDVNRPRIGSRFSPPRPNIGPQREGLVEKTKRWLSKLW